MASRCQRCGNGSEGRLCPACLEFTTALQALEMQYSAVGPRQQPDRRIVPPAGIVQVFSAAGNLQLHRLGQRTRFYCVTCRERKRGVLIATTDGDWRQTVCHPCYQALIKAQQASAKKPADRTARSGQAAQQPKKLTPTRRGWQNGLTPEPGTAKPEPRRVRRQRQQLSKRRQQQSKERQQPAQRPSGIDSLLEFLRAAGADARIGPTGYLRIDGIQIESLGQVPPPETGGWLDLVNELALTHLREKFTQMTDGHADIAADLGACLLPRERGVAIMRGGKQLGAIYPAHAFVPPRPLIYANFLTAGPHWQRVADALRDADAQRAAKAARAEARKAARSESGLRVARLRPIDQLPDDCAPELIAACLDASRRIRLERRLDYGDTPVVLDYDAGELTLLPITGPLNRLRVPFRLSDGPRNITGELILGSRDPLPLLISEGIPREDAIAAWACALLGFADATCIELFPAGPAPRYVPPRPRRRPPNTAPRPHVPPQTLPSRRRWPSYLQPAGNHTARYIDSLVRGHRRHLPQGHNARDDALDRARRIGITLRSGETWVQPHIRGHGLPDGAELRFLWHAPVELPALGS